MPTKSYQRLSFAIMLLFLTSICFSSQAFEPEEYGVEKAIFYLIEDKSEAYLGDLVNVSFVILSYTNYTMRNVSLTQKMPEQVNIVSSTFTESIGDGAEAINVTGASFDVTLDGSVDNAVIDQYYLNTSYISVHFPLMTNKTKSTFWFIVNCTSTGDALFSGGQLQWQDVYTDYVKISPVVSITIKIEAEPGPRAEIEYLGGYDNTGEDADLIIIIGAIAVPLVAVLLTRFLYKKK